MFFNFEIAYKCSVYGNNSKSYIKFNTIIAYTCMALNIVGKGVVETPWTTPAPIGAALGCMDIKAGIMVIILIILDMLLYYPFFKLMEKQKLAEENS